MTLTHVKVGDRVRRKIPDGTSGICKVTEVFRGGKWFNHDGTSSDYHIDGGCGVDFWKLVPPSIKERIYEIMYPGVVYTSMELGTLLGIGTKMISARLSELKKENRVDHIDGKWMKSSLTEQREIIDTERLDWLSDNLFNRENVDWLTGKLDEKFNMWVMFSPKGTQGSSRNIIDAAILAARK